MAILGLEDLTVGQVSGIIAAAIFLAQRLVPIALPVILSGLLRPRSAPITLSAVSWSVVTRLLHSSLWPVILQTDSAATQSTCKSVFLISIFKTFMLALIGVAAIVTPLGLYDGIVARLETGPSTFNYIKDTSSMGYGTLPRNNATWSRLCGDYLLVPCPNDFNKATIVQDDESSMAVNYTKEWYDTRIPQEVIEGFQSGRANFGDSVSSTFDIQWRSYVKNVINDVAKGPAIDNDTVRTVGSYQPLASYVLTDDVIPVEGLVIDAVNGGIGFRNHSKPTQRHSTWTEDLLFVVPETVCVDTNLTLEFSIPALRSEEMLSGYGNVFKPSIKDLGGFVNLNKTYPAWSPKNNQDDVNLWYRAYRGAWLRNAYSMAYMNVTNLKNDTLGVKAFSYLNSEIGKTFPLYFPDGEAATALSINANAIQVSTSFGDYFEGTESVSNKSTIGNTTKELNFVSKDSLYSNPFHINSKDWRSINTLCVGSGNADMANISNILAECGILYGAPRRIDNTPSLLFEPGSAWKMSMYSCISTVKATIKTTSFQFNGSDKFSDLKVVSISDKVYPNNESKPLWGVENTNMKQRDINTLWGLVSPESAAKLNLSTIRKESLYLPRSDTSIGFQNLPATDFAAAALDMTYGIPSSNTRDTVDYSGKTDLAMYRRWQELSTAPETSAKILNLIWTDIAANMVVGTRGLHDEDGSKKAKRDGTATQSAKRPQITTYSRRVKYNMVYGIPAFLALVLVTAAIASTIFFMLFGSGRPSNMREILEHTSAGRFLTLPQASHDTVQHDTCSKEPTNVWVKGTGKQQFTLGAEGWMKNAKDQVSRVDGKDGLITSYAPVSNRDAY